MTNQMRLTHNFVLETNRQLKRKAHINAERKVPLAKIFTFKIFRYINH